MFQKVEKAHLAKQKWSKGASSSMRHLRVKPTQMHPKVEQKKSHADQHEAIGGIGRSRPAQQFIAKAIARLNAKPLPVSLPTLFRSPVQSNHYKHQPLGATLATSGAPRRGEDTADGQLRPELLLLAFIEDVLSAITRSPSTQSSGSAFLASDRTSDQRGLKGGTRALCRGRASYRTEYIFNEGKEEELRAQLAVCRVFTTSRRTGRGKRRAEWLVFIMIALDWTPEKCRQRYRKRFGVETSYRLGNKLLGWTTSPNPAYRFVLIGLGFLLLNLWVHLCWLYTQVAHRGRRAFAPFLFRQVRFLNFLKHALERIYGTVNKIRAPAAAPS